MKYYADTCDREELREVLLDVLDTPVSPELLPPVDGRISQKTEDLVGPYELHDFFLYDPREGRPSRELQAFCHPKVAARTSGETFDISEKERDAILSHMFPLGPLPKSREAWIISGADKICACAEVFHITIALARDGRVAVSPA